MNLTQPTAEQEQHLQSWRATAMQMMPYMSSITFAFRPVATNLVDTFAVDENLRLYVNFENTINRGPQFNAEALLHEASHILANHFVLSKTAEIADDELDDWNVATDAAINDDLRDAGCHELAKHGVFAAQLGMADYLDPIAYMDAIRKMRQRQPKPQPTSGQSGDQPATAGDPLKGCGTGAGARAGGFELGGEGDLDGYATAASKHEIELIKINTASAIRDYQKTHGRGSVPGGLSAMVNMVLAPTKTPWQNILRSHISRSVSKTRGNAHVDSRRRDRRRYDEVLRDTEGNLISKVIVPGKSSPQPTIHFYRDTSGSVSNKGLGLASSEVLTIASKLGVRGQQLKVTDIDTQVYATAGYQRPTDLKKVSGRGGTDMRKAISHATSGRKRTWPSCIVIATDGGTLWPEHRAPVPVIALMIESGDGAVAATPDWIHVVEVEANK